MKAIVLVRQQEKVEDGSTEVLRQRLIEIGFAEVASVRLGRIIEIEIEGADLQGVKNRVERMCDIMLVNSDYEEFEIVFEE